jgi:outer membrane protein
MAQANARRCEARLSWLACGLGLAALASAGKAGAENLADAITSAYRTNPTLQSQRAQLRITDEIYVQARAGYRPKVSVEVDTTRQDYSRQTANSGSAIITATQPLYSGGRTAAAVSAAEADILSGREALRAAEANVLQSVVQVYADVLRDQEGVAIRQENLTALLDQLKEAQARAKVGDLTRTDVAQSLGYVSQARIDLANAMSQLEASRASYAAVIGQAPAGLEPLPKLPNMPADIIGALATAEVGNPTLRSSLYVEQAARLRTAESRAERLPQVSLRAQYGYSGPSSPFLPQIYPRDATATATITLPLFSGGVISSQVRQQIEREATARIQTDQARRTIIQQINQAWNALQAANQNIGNAEEEVQADTVAYEGVQKERRADLRSTLDVLSIEQSLRQAELARSAAKHDAYVSAATMLNVMGLMEAKALVPGIDVYDPAEAFERVRRSGAVPWESVPAALDHLTTPPLRVLP